MCCTGGVVVSEWHAVCVVQHVTAVEGGVDKGPLSSCQVM